MHLNSVVDVKCIGKSNASFNRLPFYSDLAQTCCGIMFVFVPSLLPNIFRCSCRARHKLSNTYHKEDYQNGYTNL